MNTQKENIILYFIYCLIVLCIFFLFMSECHAQTLGQWRWSEQEFMDAPYDNIQHLGTGLISFVLDQTTNLEWWQNDLIALGCGVLFEIKDGLVPYEEFGRYGGEGYSWMDVRTDIAGIAINRILSYVIKRNFKIIKINVFIGG